MLFRAWWRTNKQTNNRVNLEQVCSLNIEQSRLLQFFKSYIEAICISIELAVLHFRMKPLLQKAILHARIQLYGCTEDLWKGKLKWLRKTTKKGTELSTSKNPGGLSSKLWKVRCEKTRNKVKNVKTTIQKICVLSQITLLISLCSLWFYSGRFQLCPITRSTRRYIHQVGFDIWLKNRYESNMSQ